MLALALALLPQSDGAPPDAPGAAMDELVRAYVDAGEFSGAVLVARGDEVLLRAAYGLADAARGVANTPETRFHVASLTKTFTAALVQSLAADGRLALADPVAKLLPDYPRGAEITIEHLLLHRAGIPEARRRPGFDERARGRVTAREMVEWTSALPLEFAPGSASSYSNSGYTLLAHLCERAAEEEPRKCCASGCSRRSGWRAPARRRPRPKRPRARAATSRAARRAR